MSWKGWLDKKYLSDIPSVFIYESVRSTNNGYISFKETKLNVHSKNRLFLPGSTEYDGGSSHPLELNNAVPHLFSMKYLPCIEPSHCSTDRRWLRIVLPRTWLGSEEEKKGEKATIFLVFWSVPGSKA